jgi:hypothetical protein
MSRGLGGSCIDLPLATLTVATASEGDLGQKPEKLADPLTGTSIVE